MGRQAHRQGWRRCCAAVPVGPRSSTRTKDVLIDITENWGQRCFCASRQWRAGATAFSRTSTNSARASPIRGQEGRRAHDLAAPKLIADAGLLGMPNAGNPLFLAGRSTRGPRLPITVHHPASQSGCRWASITAEFVMAIFRGLIAGASRAGGLATASLAMSSAARCCCIWSMALRHRWTRDYRAIINELELYGGESGRQATRHRPQQDRRVAKDERGRGTCPAGKGRSSAVP